MGYERRNREFGELLKKWRMMRRYSQFQLAVDLGVSSRHLSFIETGRSKPSHEMVLLLAEHLDLPHTRTKRPFGRIRPSVRVGLLRDSGATVELSLAGSMLVAKQSI
jgi:transcriptional regulator with XRE-family HTH domain